MKQIIFAIILIASSLYSFAQGDVIKYSITIDEFEKDELTKFDDFNGKSYNISTENVRIGINIKVPNELNIDSLTVLNAADKYTTYYKNSCVPELITHTCFLILTPYTGGRENKILIKMHRKDSVKEITLIVDPSANGGQERQETKTPCELFKTETKNSDCNKNKKYFGENVDYYTDNTVVYVYDFNNDPSKRVFYKITKNEKSKDGLQMVVVNFNNETLSSGNDVRFKIYNINKFMYKVSIADSVVQYDSEPPALLTEYFLGDKDGLLGSLQGTFSSDVNALSKGTKSLADTLLKEIDCFIQNYNNLKSIALDAYNPCKTFHCCNSFDYTDFLTSLAYIKAQSKIVEKKLNDAKKGDLDCYDQFKLKIKAETEIKNLNFTISKFNLRIEELTAQNTSLINNVDRIKNEIQLIESQIFFLKGADSLTKNAQLLRLVTELTSKNNELATSRIDIAKVKKDRDSLEIKRETFVNSIDSIKFAINQVCDSTIEDMIDVLEVSHYLINNLPSERELKELIIFINNMVEQNYSYSKDFMSLNGNMIDLTLTISSKDSITKFTGIKVDESISIQIPIICKPFASFSSGSFIAFGNNLQNKTHDWVETVGNNNTVNSDSYTLVESGYTLPPMGFSALGNLEWKLSRSYGLGGSIGIGLSIENSPRLAYLGGLSLFIGELRQFAITIGFAGMQVNKLTNNFQSISDNQVIYTSKPDIQYYNEFKVGTFISLTYTPFEVYKTKSVKSK